MFKTTLIYRKSEPHFNSIENVFNTLSPFLKARKIELPNKSKGFINRLKNILFVRKEKNTLIHITGNDHYLALGLKKEKTILTIHDIEVLKRSNGIKKFILKKLWYDCPIKKVKVVTTISEFSKNEILSLNNYDTRIVVIHNPITLPIKSSNYIFNEKCPTILHIGTKLNKNLDRLANALNGIKCHLVIIGSLKKKTKETLNNNNISFTTKHNLTNKEMIEEYRNCDMLAFISTYEGFGLPIIEAQAMGRPVITSTISSMPEIAGDSALLVNPYSIEEIQSGIHKIINERSFREQLIKKGLENINRFSPQKIANQYLELYGEVLNEK